MKFNIKQAQEAAAKEEQTAKKVTVTQANNTVKNAAVGSDKELDFNRKHREDYETLMAESSTQLDGYWDSKNPFVKLLLFGLAVVIVLGVIYYVMTYFATMK